MSTIKSIAIVGGTHGNELTGINILTALESDPFNEFDDIFQFQHVLANADAVTANVRFIDVDLNRQFTFENLTCDNDMLHELTIAKMINQQIGPKGASKTDLVIDIHNTTSAMGATLILLEDSPFYRNMGGYLKMHMPDVNILLEDEVTYQEHPYLCTIGTRGIMLELGSQPQGVSRMDILLQCKAMLQHVFAYCDLYNRELLSQIPRFDAFRLIENINFPLDDEGEIKGLVHESLLDKDFCRVEVGAPIFRLFDGTEICLTGSQAIYPHFINEAAYLKSKVAFATATKFEW